MIVRRRSLQASSRSKQLWKDEVARRARIRISETDELGFLDDRAVSVTIFHFLSQLTSGDIDNISKPILDALVGVAYLDDGQVERLLIQRFDAQLHWAFGAKSEVLARALEIDPPVVYVRVDDDLMWREIR